jgi:hypothetical protein
MLKFSTHQELFENEGLKNKSTKSGISYGTLKKVYNRGMAAWKTGHRPGTTPQQWAMARVNSYIGKGKGTYYGADSDISGKGKKESVGEAHKPGHHDDKHIKQAIGIASDPRYAKGNMTGAVKAMNKLSPGLHKHPQVAAVLKRQNEALDKKDTDSVKKVIKGLKGAVKAHSGQVKSLTKDIQDGVQVKEISKNLAKNYIGKASRDVFDKGRADATQDAIGKLGGKHKDQDYNKGPERKASMRVRGIDRATNRLMKKEAMSDAEKAAHQKAIDAFKSKGGKIKKLPVGYADGWTGKADPGAGIKGMIAKADTKDFGTKKKIGSMKR